MVSPRWTPLAFFTFCWVAHMILRFGFGFSLLTSALLALAVGTTFGSLNRVMARRRAPSPYG